MSSATTQATAALHMVQSPNPCLFCGGKISVYARPRNVRFDKRKFCTLECRKKHHAKLAEKIDRKCCDCLAIKTRAEFTRFGEKSNKLRPYCKACEVNHGRKNKGRCVVVADHTCKVCHDIITGTQPFSAVNRRVTCSRACELKNKRRESICCSLCHKDKPYEAFDALKGKSYALHAYCRECRAKDTEIVYGDIRIRPSYIAMYNMLSSACKRMKRVMTLTPVQTKRLWNKPCCLCGGLTGKLVSIDKSLPLSKDNVMPYCRICARLREYFSGSIEQMRQQAQKIAEHTATL